MSRGLGRVQRDVLAFLGKRKQRPPYTSDIAFAIWPKTRWLTPAQLNSLRRALNDLRQRGLIVCAGIGYYNELQWRLSEQPA